MITPDSLWLDNTKLKITATANKFEPTSSDVNALRIFSDVDCRIRINPIEDIEADADSTFIPAGHIEYIPIRKKGNLSVIKTTENGTLEITEIKL